MKYPDAPHVDVIDILHGVAVPDPFRRLESADDAATAAWVAEQNALTRRLLDSPLRDGLAARLRELHRVPRMSVPAVRGDRIFFTENDGSRAQAVLYLERCSGGPACPPREGARSVLIDPNSLSGDGTTAITVFEPDGTGDRVVYGLSRHGSDVQQLLMHDVASGATFADRLDWVKFASIAWHGDGFFYTRYPQPGTVPLQDPIEGQHYDWPVGFRQGLDLKDFWQLEEHTLGETTFTHFADGTGHKNRMQGNDFVQSVMYTRGVTCFSCHDVHGTGNNAELIKPVKQLCLTCHGPNSPNGPHAASIEAHTHHQRGSAGSECVACHMPRIEQTIADVNVRSHTFKFITPGMTDQFKTPNPCTECHTDRTTEWARETLKGWSGPSPWRMN